MDAVETSNFAEDNKLIKYGALLITQLLVTKEIKNKKREERNWGKKQLSLMNAPCQDFSPTEIWEAGMLRKESHKTKLNHLYWKERKGYKRAAEERKQQIKTKAATLKWYANRVKPAGNYMFKVNNRNTRTRCEICLKLTIKTPERR